MFIVFTSCGAEEIKESDKLVCLYGISYWRLPDGTEVSELNDDLTNIGCNEGVVGVESEAVN